MLGKFLRAMVAGVAGQYGFQSASGLFFSGRLDPLADDVVHSSISLVDCRPTEIAGRKSCSVSSHGAETSGIPQASASKTRMVGMPFIAPRVLLARHMDGGATRWHTPQALKIGKIATVLTQPACSA